MKIYFILFVFHVSALASTPCQEDIQDFCGDKNPGSGAVMECMKEKNALGLLSSECKSYLESIIGSRAPSSKKEKKADPCDTATNHLPKGTAKKIQTKKTKIPADCLKNY